MAIKRNCHRRPKLNRIQAYVRRLLIEAECCSSNGHMMSTLAGFWLHHSRHITKFTSIKRCMESAIICRVHHFPLFPKRTPSTHSGESESEKVPETMVFPMNASSSLVVSQHTLLASSSPRRACTGTRPKHKTAIAATNKKYKNKENAEHKRDHSMVYLGE